jgi:hypothetical protein
MLFTIILSIHNLMRWVVLILAIVAIVKAFLGWFRDRPWTEQDSKFGSYYTISLDIQFLLGIILYIFLSPLTHAFFSNLSAGLANPNLRFFGLEHIFYMFVAVALGHMGTAFSRRADVDQKKHRNAAIFFSLSLLVILIAIPWGRPLLRLPF